MYSLERKVIIVTGKKRFDPLKIGGVTVDLRKDPPYLKKSKHR